MIQLMFLLLYLSIFRTLASDRRLQFYLLIEGRGDEESWWILDDVKSFLS
jgi:hypothetical protein